MYLSGLDLEAVTSWRCCRGSQRSPSHNSPICARDTAVRVSGLIPGAPVLFRSDGNDFALTQAWDSSCDFEMPDVAGVGVLTVIQGLCNPPIRSDSSNKVGFESQAEMGDLFLKLASPVGRKCL
jgi:hypothetical protein